MKRFLAGFLASLLLCSAVGCNKETKKKSPSASGSSSASQQSGKSGKDAKILFIPKSSENPYYQAAFKGVEEMGKEVGFESEYAGGVHDSVADQAEAIEKSAEQGFTGIVLAGADATGANGAIEKVKEKGIQVVTWDTDISADHRAVFVAQGTAKEFGPMLVDLAASQMTDMQKRDAKILFFYDSPTASIQSAWVDAARDYIKQRYPGWKEFAEPYYSDQEPEQALREGKKILDKYADVDAILCPDSIAFVGQAQAVQSLKRSKQVIVTGFAYPKDMKDFMKDGTVEKFGTWDCKKQGAIAGYISYWLAQGNEIKVGEKIEVPKIGELEVQENKTITKDAYESKTSGVVLLPELLTVDKKTIESLDF